MSTMTNDVLVNCPVRQVYDQWTQFEEFPAFMEGVQAVAQESDGLLSWTAQIGGQQRSWKARIVEQRPDEVIAWCSVEGVRNAGVVRFEPVDPEHTRVLLELDFEPEGIVEQVADKMGVVSRRADGDLRRFKEFIESRMHATGAWRGEIHHGHVDTENPLD